MSEQRAPVRIASIIRIYLRALLKHPILLTFTVIGMVGLQYSQLAVPLYIRSILDTLSANLQTPDVVTGLGITLGIIAALYLLSWVSRRVMNFSVMYLELQAMSELTNRAFAYVLDHSQHFFSSQFVGTLTRRVRKFGDAFESLLDVVVYQFAPALIFVGGAAVILYTRHPILGIVLALGSLVLVILQIQLARWQQQLRLERSAQDSKMTGTLADALTNQTNVTLFAATGAERSRFASAVEAWRKASVRAWNNEEVIWSILGICMIAIEIALLWVGILLWQQGVLTVGDFVLIQLYVIGAFDRVININQNLRRFYNALADASEMVEILETPHDIVDAVHAHPLIVAKGAVVFDAVDFSFVNDRPILSGFDLSIKGGEKVALVGPSGAGKSTITKLLLRLYDVTGGTVRIDGQDVREITQGSLREAVSFVPQEPILFHRTLRENIAYGKPGATDEEVVEAAKKAHAHEFISSFPEGYNTYVGERGVKLSGGERQRVAIARAILKNAPILILDEATSSLDSESEALIQDALHTLMQGKTVIVIAHRLSTIMSMDRIVVVEGGKVIAEGTHDELVADTTGLYHKLWSIQAGGFLAE